MTAAPARTATAQPLDSPVVRWFTRPGSPTVLAAVRIGVFAAVIYTGLTFDPRAYARLPHELIDEPRLAGWMVTALPITPTWAAAGWLVMMVAAALAMLGWRVAWTGTVTVAAATYVIGITNLFGKVNHNHHLLWMGLLLAASPCADALAVDAPKRRPPCSAAYGFPLRATWVLLGVIYLGAGIPKIQSGGLTWALSDNLRDEMWVAWWIHHMEPVVRVDRYPAIYETAGLLTLAFELGFIAAVIWGPTRRAAVVLGLGFHLATRFMLAIFFVSIFPLYLAFLPSRGPTEDRAPQRRSVAVGLCLIVAALLASMFTVQDGWPIGSYPGFPKRDDPTFTMYRVTSTDGSPIGDELGLGLNTWSFLQQRIGSQPQLLPLIEDYVGHDLLLSEEIVWPDPDHPRVTKRQVPTS